MSSAVLLSRSRRHCTLFAEFQQRFEHPFGGAQRWEYFAVGKMHVERAPTAIRRITAS
jgi:hypothetical protein